jgi:tRNA/tmRNA/rRNA uracil-C5-methylase (TrmA/RlmC/RlmD family)
MGRELPAAVVNPPRAGLSPAVIEGLVRLRPRELAYVSCRPATLARDLAALASDYMVEEVIPVDMLPLTPHIEALALLRTREPGGATS